MKSLVPIALLWAAVGAFQMPGPHRAAFHAEARDAQRTCVAQLDYPGGVAAAVRQIEINNRRPGTIEYERAGCYIECLMDYFNLVDNNNMVDLESIIWEYKMRTWAGISTLERAKETVDECNKAVKDGFWRRTDVGSDVDNGDDGETLAAEYGKCSGASIFFDCVRYHLKMKWPSSYWQRLWGLS